jgi:hypothetical protein
MGMFIWRTNTAGDQELHVFQSNGQGISEMTIEKFWETNDGTAIIILPLAPDWRAKWDETKAYTWFKTVEGSPYGYANFLMGFFDTPEDNFPQVIDSNSWWNFMTLLNSIPEVGPQLLNLVWTRAFGKRLGIADESITWF